MLGFASLFVLFMIALVVIGIVLATLNRAARQTGNSPYGRCGACGYATQGLTELKCPECGASLTEVGIVRDSDLRSPLAGCLLPFLMTIVVFLLAVGSFMLVSQIVPMYEDQSTHFDLWSESDAYSEVLLSTEMTLIIPANASHHAHNFSVSSNPGSNQYSTTIDYGGGPNATVKVDSISVEVMTTQMQQSHSGIMYAPKYRVDPATQVATWSDAQGNAKTSSGPATDKDLLAYFADQGIDTTRQDVIAEVQELATVIDGLIAGQNQFTLNGFQSGGYGSGSSGSIGPPWFVAAYFGGWFVIWIVALVVIARRSRNNAAAATA